MRDFLGLVFGNFSAFCVGLLIFWETGKVESVEGGDLGMMRL